MTSTESAAGLDGTIAIVTAAGSGIGRASAAALGAAGAVVVLVDLNEEGLRSAAADMPGKTETVVADVTTAEGASRVKESALNGCGGIDFLINVVGGSARDSDVTEMSEAEWRGLIDLNLTSVYQMCHAIIPAMATRGGGAVVNVASGAGLYGMPRSPGYAAGKAGVIGLTKALAIDHAASGIRVNCIAPGPTRTYSMRTHRSAEEIAFFGQGSLLARVAEPEEIASVVLFLCSQQASYVNGQIIEVDGGRRPPYSPVGPVVDRR